MKDLLEGLTEQEQKLVTHSREGRVLPAGALVYRAGDPADGIFQVLAGEVEYLTTASDGAEVSLGTATDGEVFGFAGAIPGPAVRYASVRARRTTSILELRLDPVDLLHKHVGARPACILLRNILGRIAALVDKLMAQHGADKVLRLVVHPEMKQDSKALVARIGEAAPDSFFDRLFSHKTFKAGESIMAQGPVPERFYYLKSGTVLFGHEGQGGKETVLRANAPDVIGQVAYFAQTPMLFTVIAATEATAIPFTESTLQALIDKDPDQALLVLDAIARLMVGRVTAFQFQR